MSSPILFRLVLVDWGYIGKLIKIDFNWVTISPLFTLLNCCKSASLEILVLCFSPNPWECLATSSYASNAKLLIIVLKNVSWLSAICFDYVMYLSIYFSLCIGYKTFCGNIIFDILPISL